MDGSPSESGAILTQNVRSGRRLTALELLCQGFASAEAVAAREATRAFTQQSSHCASDAEIHCDDGTGKEAIPCDSNAEEQSTVVSQQGTSHPTCSTTSHHANEHHRTPASARGEECECAAEDEGKINVTESDDGESVQDLVSGSKAMFPALDLVGDRGTV
jgi:hypothetical protein